MNDREVRIRFRIDSDTRELVVTEKEIQKLGGAVSGTRKQTGLLGDSLKKIAGLAGGIYGLKAAFDAVFKRGFEYNSQLEKSIQGLTALTVATSENTTSTGRAITLQEKYALAQREAAETAAKLQQINARTPHTLNETNRIYKAMYVSMKNAGASTDDMVRLTEKISIAAGAAGIEFNSLLAGVDGLASGTVLANSDLGRFLASIGLSNEALKQTDDIVGLLNEKLADFEAADTMEVAISNLENAWDGLAGAITEDVFADGKQAINDFSTMLNDNRDDIVEFGKDTIAGVTIVSNGFQSIYEMAKLGYLEIGAEFSGEIEETLNGVISIFEDAYNSIADTWLGEQLGYEHTAFDRISVGAKDFRDEIDETKRKIEQLGKSTDKAFAQIVTDTTAAASATKTLANQTERLVAKHPGKPTPKEALSLDPKTLDIINNYNEALALITPQLDKVNDKYMAMYSVVKDLFSSEQMDAFFMHWQQAAESAAGNTVMNAFDDADDKVSDKFYDWADTLQHSMTDSIVRAIDSGDIEGALTSLAGQMSASMLQASVANIMAGNLWSENSMTASASRLQLGQTVGAVGGSAMGGGGIGAGVGGQAGAYFGQAYGPLGALFGGLAGGVLGGAADRMFGGGEDPNRYLKRIAELAETRNNLLELQTDLYDSAGLKGSSLVTGLEKSLGNITDTLLTEFDNEFNVMEQNIFGKWQYAGIGKDAWVQDAIKSMSFGDLYTLLGGAATHSTRHGDNMYTATEGSLAGYKVAFDDLDSQSRHIISGYRDAVMETATAIVKASDVWNQAVDKFASSYDRLTGTDYFASKKYLDALSEVNDAFGEDLRNIDNLAAALKKLGSSSIDLENFRDQALSIMESFKNVDFESMDADEMIAFLESNGFEQFARQVDEMRNILGDDIVGSMNAEALLNISDALDIVSDAVIKSKNNIDKWNDSFKSQSELLAEQAKNLGIDTFASDLEELNALFLRLSSDSNGLSDAEYKFLNANKSYIEGMENAAMASRKAADDIRLTFARLGGDQVEYIKLQEQILAEQYLAAARELGLDTSNAAAEDVIRAWSVSNEANILKWISDQDTADWGTLKEIGNQLIRLDAQLQDLYSQQSTSTSSSGGTSYTYNPTTYYTYDYRDEQQRALDALHVLQSHGWYREVGDNVGALQNRMYQLKDILNGRVTTNEDDYRTVTSAISDLDSYLQSLGDTTEEITKIDLSPLSRAADAFGSIADTARGFVDTAMANNLSYSNARYSAAMADASEITALIASGGDYTQDDLSRLRDSTDRAASYARTLLGGLDKNSFAYRMRQNVIAHQIGAVGTEAESNKKTFADVVAALEKSQQNEQRLIAINQQLLDAMRRNNIILEESA